MDSAEGKRGELNALAAPDCGVSPRKPIEASASRRIKRHPVPPSKLSLSLINHAARLLLPDENPLTGEREGVSSFRGTMIRRQVYGYPGSRDLIESGRRGGRRDGRKGGRRDAKTLDGRKVNAATQRTLRLRGQPWLHPQKRFGSKERRSEREVACARSSSLFRNPESKECIESREGRALRNRKG